MSFFLVLAAALLVFVATLVLYAQTRRSRRHAPLSGDAVSPSASGGSELRELAERIEAAVTQQQQQGETQRQRLAQQIDGVQQSVGEQRVLVDNLRSEVRHESKRRDTELEEIRHQIASIHHALPALGGTPPTDQLALSAADEATEAPADPFVTQTQDLVDSTGTADASSGESDWEDVAWEVNAAPTASSEPSEAHNELAPAVVESEDVFTFEDAFADASFEDVTAGAEETAAPEAFVEETPAETFMEVAPAEASDDQGFAIENHQASADAVAEELAFASRLDAPAVTEPVVDALATPDLPSSTDAAAPSAWNVHPDATAETNAPAEAMFEELTLAEMSFEEFSFEEFSFEDLSVEDADDAGAPGDVETGVFDADPFTVEEAADPSVMIAEASEMTSESHQAFPALAAAPAFTEAIFASSQTEPDASVQSETPESSFAPTPFLDNTLPVADPLAFEEAFVPAPIVDAAPPATEKADDLFAAWSPAEAPEAAAEVAETEAALEPLTFVEVPAPPASDDHTAVVEADPADASSTDLSTFEDWGLDPIPMAAPASDATWTTPKTTSSAFDAWAPSQAVTPEIISTPPPAPAPSNATAWVARNESLQPTPPPAPQPPAADPAPYAEATPVAEPAELASGFEPQPALAEAPTHASHADATFPSGPSSEAAPELASAGSVAPVAAPVSAPAVSAPAEPTAAPTPSDSDRLTVLPSIDDDIERALYLAGVTSLDEMARWGRTEARRIAAEVGVSEDTVLNQWVFEAQTALFERFTQQAGV